MSFELSEPSSTPWNQDHRISSTVAGCNKGKLPGVDLADDGYMEKRTANLVWLFAAGCTFGTIEPELRPIDGPEQSSASFASERSHLPRRAIRADRPPPPVSGGTLEANTDFVVAADPVRDTVWIVKREGGALALSGQVDLELGAEPGRVTLRGNDALVVLRGAGAVARIDLLEARITQQTEVCEAPRGIDARRSGFVVACVGGSLVYLDDELRVTEKRHIRPDLRDVVVQYDSSGSEVVWVSTFRSAQILELRGTETVEHAIEPSLSHVPRVAWRMRSHTSGSDSSDSGDSGVDVLHQQMSEANFNGLPLAYYGSASTPPTGRIVQAAIAHIRMDGTQVLHVVDGVPLAVDFVRRTSELLFAAAFHRSRDTDAEPGLYSAAPDALTTGIVAHNATDIPTQSVASADDFIVSFSARNGVLLSSFGLLDLAEPVIDTGHDLFHATTPAEVTCASCHPGGRDDAYVWTFSGERRRTQPLTGGILASAPYHWTGELPGLEEVVFATFDTRMNGPDATPSQVAALGLWLDSLPTLRIPPEDTAAVARGEALYAARRCATCHDVSVDPTATLVRDVQAPTLFGVGVRGPYFHDGCAETLHDALGRTSCGDHALLTDEELDDTVAYLRQL